MSSSPWPRLRNLAVRSPRPLRRPLVRNRGWCDIELKSERCLWWAMVQDDWSLHIRHIVIVVHSCAVFTTLSSYPSLSSLGVFDYNCTRQRSYESRRRSNETTFPFVGPENDEMRGFCSNGLLDRSLSARTIQALRGNCLDL